ncbi:MULTISPECIES: PfkB family carbohydrate kinase [unclassified Mesorhizobium]|uniref:PfkB family carbohydrate kinase n=1 Tax=unclassified Mesorhizobium TaxID=325217 RepID=UPI0030148865
MKSSRILAIGGAHIVRHGQITGSFTPGEFNPGVMREDVGGDAFNAARIVIRHGDSASLISVRGGDVAGETVSCAIAAEGISDLSVIFLDRKTPSRTVLLDSDHRLIAGLDDTALYDLVFPKQMRRSKMREAVAQSDAILCDAAMPAAALEKLATLAAGKPLFAIAESSTRILRFANLLPELACLFMKREGAIVLSGDRGKSEIASIAEELRERGLACGIIMEDDGTTVGFDRKSLFSIRALDPAYSLAALAGATIVALMRGLPMREALSATSPAQEPGTHLPARKPAS